MKNQKSYEIIKQAVRNSMSVELIRSTIEKKLKKYKKVLDKIQKI